MANVLFTKPLAPAFQVSGGILRGLPNTQKSSAPQFCDIGFAVAAPQQFGGNIHALTFVLPTDDTTAMVEVRRNADVIHADPLHRIIYGIHELRESCWRRRGNDLVITFRIFILLGLRKRSGRFPADESKISLQRCELVNILLWKRAQIIAERYNLDYSSVFLDQIEFGVAQVARRVHQSLHRRVRRGYRRVR